MNGSTLIEADAGMIFSGRPSGKKVTMWSAPSDYTPVINPEFVAPDWAQDILVWLLNGVEPLYLFGPTGSGKSSCVKQIVARLNYPVYEVTGHNRLEFPELVGHHTVVTTPDGKSTFMKYELGPLSLAMLYGGVFLFNEFDLLDPSTAVGFNTILDGAPLVIPEAAGMIIKPHPLFRFAVTANTNGGGDSTGLYQGTLRMNLALCDRFLFVESSYLPEDVELNLLARVAPTLPGEIRKRMVQFAWTVRKMHLGGDAENTSEITCSTRSLLRWARLMIAYAPLRSTVDVAFHTLERALLFRASNVTKLALKEVYQRIFGTSDIVK